ncbi:MAG TPA: DASS family sodium-coupled anion symporter [Flavobacterium sp.]|nr:DASS family sodium-coupled anion symporter [Flavobacterium sp.]
MEDYTIQDRVKRLVIFLGCIILAAGITFFIKEPTFTDSQVYVLFLLFFAIGLWLTEIVPAFAVSLIIISFLVFTLGNEHLNSAPENTDKYAQTFSNSVIWLMLGGFFLASAMTKTKLDEVLFKFTIKISGSKPVNLLIGIMLTTMVASMLMSNTATTAMVVAAVLPLLNSLGKDSKITKALLIGIAISASTGGMGTIIGTPPNAIAVGILESNGVSISFLEWMKYGIPISFILTAISCIALIKIYIKDNTPVSMEFLEKDVEPLSKSFLFQRKIVVFVIIITVGLWLTTSFHGLKVASICAFPLVILTITRVLDGNDVQRLAWDTLLLVAGGLSLGLALEQTGLLTHYANMLISINVNIYILFFIFAFAVMIISNIMSNTAASTVMIPLGIAIMLAFKMEIALIIALSASTSMLLPVSTPPNAIIYSTGFLKQKDFRIGGILVGLLGPLLIILWVLFLA